MWLGCDLGDFSPPQLPSPCLLTCQWVPEPQPLLVCERSWLCSWLQQRGLGLGFGRYLCAVTPGEPSPMPLCKCLADARFTGAVCWWPPASRTPDSEMSKGGKTSSARGQGKVPADPLNSRLYSGLWTHASGLTAATRVEEEEEEGSPRPRGSLCLHLCFLPDLDCLGLGSLLSKSLPSPSLRRAGKAGVASGDRGRMASVKGWPGKGCFCEVARSGAGPFQFWVLSL